MGDQVFDFGSVELEFAPSRRIGSKPERPGKDLSEVKISGNGEVLFYRSLWSGPVAGSLVSVAVIKGEPIRFLAVLGGIEGAATYRVGESGKHGLRFNLGAASAPVSGFTCRGNGAVVEHPEYGPCLLVTVRETNAYVPRTRTKMCATVGEAIEESAKIQNPGYDTPVPSA